jgi:predicted pyridoxine 5'-phosphate oxidase superfamily flavin-nucleotide-binding protein
MERRIVLITERAYSTTVNDIQHIESESIEGLGLEKIYFQPGTDIGSAIAQCSQSIFSIPAECASTASASSGPGQSISEPEQVYGNCRRYIQERIILGWRPIDPAHNGVVAPSSSLSAPQRDQITRADTFFFATDHLDSGADLSHKGGSPGFVRVVDARRLAFPDYNGNNMFNSLGNIMVNPHAGLLFIDFDGGRTLQLTGFASIDWTAERALLLAGPSASSSSRSRKSSTIAVAFRC